MLAYEYDLANGPWEGISVWMDIKSGVVSHIVLWPRNRVPIALDAALHEAGLDSRSRSGSRDTDYHYTDASGRLVYPRLGVTFTVAEGDQVAAMVFSAKRP
jgi:hypothetical protein